MASLKIATANTARVAAAPVAKANKFMVWQPVNNKFFETFSYLPPLTDDQIARQVDYIVNNGWTPCLEFSDAANAYTSNANVVRIQNGATPNYYDNRYWTMWKLPMFGCTDPSQVLKEIAACVKACPDAYVRMAAFDANRQVQVTSMLVHRPTTAKDWKAPDKRQLA